MNACGNSTPASEPRATHAQLVEQELRWWSDWRERDRLPDKGFVEEQDQHQNCGDKHGHRLQQRDVAQRVMAEVLEWYKWCGHIGAR